VNEKSWHLDPVSFRAGGRVTCGISAVFETQEGRKHASVFYIGEDGFLHYYYVRDGNWRHDGEAFKRPVLPLLLTTDMNLLYSYR